jgi:hypothetical protein
MLLIGQSLGRLHDIIVDRKCGSHALSSCITHQMSSDEAAPVANWWLLTAMRSMLNMQSLMIG